QRRLEHGSGRGFRPGRQRRGHAAHERTGNGASHAKRSSPSRGTRDHRIIQRAGRRPSPRLGSRRQLLSDQEQLPRQHVSAGRGGPDRRGLSMRIAIVNDLALAREVLRRLVRSVPGYTVAWTAENGEEAVRKASEDLPDIILMDLIMPVLDGVEATRRIM